MLDICEIFRSVQGESTHTGRVCIFVRLSGCNLNCVWCDTTYAESEFTAMSVEAVLGAVESQGSGIVELTGGEPLRQPEIAELAKRLCDSGREVLIETNGSYDIGVLDSRVIRIVDVKTPGSGHEDSFLAANIQKLRLQDECKFVIADRADFEWSVAFVNKYGLEKICTVIFSPVMGMCSPADLADWILATGNEKIRLGIQMHKVIWGEKRGV